MDQLEDKLEKDFKKFLEALADDGVIRKVVVDGVNFYFNESDPQYKEYLALKEGKVGSNNFGLA
ncbi:MAG: hypothetical protein R8K20_02150 [Gallionellaceae bacterium]